MTTGRRTTGEIDPSGNITGGLKEFFAISLQKMRESDRLLAIERERAKKRQIRKPESVKAMLPEQNKAQSRDIVADKIGMSGCTLSIEREWVKKRQIRKPESVVATLPPQNEGKSPPGGIGALTFAKRK